MIRRGQVIRLLGVPLTQQPTPLCRIRPHAPQLQSEKLSRVELSRLQWSDRSATSGIPLLPPSHYCSAIQLLSQAPWGPACPAQSGIIAKGYCLPPTGW